MKKYELEESTIRYEGRILHRIRALRDFGNVKKGDLGGFVESESNLSHEGTCWIYGNAKVFNKARVSDNATIHGDTIVKDRALVCNNADIFADSRITIRDSAIVEDEAKVYGNIIIGDYATIKGRSRVIDNASIYGNAVIRDNAIVKGESEICGNAVLKDNKVLIGKLTSDVDDFIEIQNPEGRIVTCIIKGGKLAFNVKCKVEMTEDEFIDRIKNEDGGLENNPHREYYFKT